MPLYRTPSFYGDFSREDLVKLFGLIDRNGDGTLTKKEIKKGLALMRQSGVVQSASQIFKASDDDGDSTIGVEEFCEFMRKTESGPVGPRELFEQIDRNGDGRLTKKEIKKGLALISQSTGVVQSARLIFDAMDGDGSDSIDVEEFCEFMSAAAASPAELFAKIDRNGATLPFLGLSLSCHCLSLAFHCRVTAFPWPSTVVSPPVTDFPHCL